MPAYVIRADYKKLSDVAGSFASHAEQLRDARQRLVSAMQTLQAGDWMGEGASEFYAEMNDQVLPTYQRLDEALRAASSTTRQVSQLMKAAEDEAAQYLRGDGSGAAGPAGAASRAALAGPLSTSQSGFKIKGQPLPASATAQQPSGTTGREETLVDMAARIIGSAKEAWETATEAGRIAKAMAEELNIATKELDDLNEALDNTYESLEKANKLAKRVRAIQDLIKKMRAADMAQKEYLADKENPLKGIAWANRSAEAIEAAKIFAPEGLPFVGPMITGYLETVPKMVKQLTGQLQAHLARIDQTQGKLESILDFGDGREVVNPTYVTKAHLQIIRELFPNNAELQYELLRRTESRGSLRRGLAEMGYSLPVIVSE